MADNEKLSRLYHSNIKDLEKSSDRKLSSKQPKMVLNTYNKGNFLARAMDLYKKGHLEDSYATIYRCLSILSYIGNDKGNFDGKTVAKIHADFNEAITFAELLQKELKELYSQKEIIAQKVAEKLADSQENVPTEQALLETRYSCAWLHQQLINEVNQVLLIDTRASDQFVKSHIEFPNVNLINVSETIIEVGASANVISERLSASFSSLWNRRKDFLYVVLFHLKSNAKPPELLYSILSKYDKVQYQNLVILEEGYADWYNFYAHLVIGDLPECDSIYEDSEQPNLSNIFYEIEPFHNDFSVAQHFFEELPNRSHHPPQIDRTKKPSLSNGKQKNDIFNAFQENEEEEKLQRLEKQIEIEEERGALMLTEGKKIAEECNALKNESKAKDALINKLVNEREQINKENKELIARQKLVEIRNSKPKILSAEQENNKRNSVESSLKLNEKENNAQFQFHRGVEPYIPKIDRSNKPKIIIPEIGKSPGLTGLKNLGNTCYMNSILQCISNNSTLAKYLSLYQKDVTRKQGYGGEIAEKVADVVRALWAGNHRAVTCQPLKSAVGSLKPEYKSFEQQDSHEFLTFLMDWLHSDLKKEVPMIIKNEEETEMEKVWRDFKIKNESMISTLFYGLQRSTVECSKCREKSSTYEPFSNLSLFIPEGNSVTLQECIQLYLNKESVSGWRCPKCKFELEAKKYTDLCKLPCILVIHLKRFSFLDVSSKKRTTFVDFPLSQLHLTTSNGETRSYDLYGVSNHYGTIEGGHYTAYCKNPFYDRWYKFDDHEVLDLAPKNVVSNAAYILFYTSPDIKQNNNS